MKHLKVPENLAQAVVNYLGTRPFGEVFQLIQELQKVEIINEEKTETS